MNQAQRIKGFTEAIWEWYARHKRQLPWRDMAITDETQRAYRVMVSEVMLQQTQVSRVQIVFKHFLELFPSIQDLACASNKDVIMAWRGMGYNSRALRLRDAAKSVVEEHGGVFPQEMDELLAIKGLGPYTAAAIRNFAFNIPSPCIDTNIRRILHRTFVGPENSDGTWNMGDGELLKIAEEVLKTACHTEVLQRSHEVRHSMLRGSASGLAPQHDTSFIPDAANWHAALMDYGSLVQTKNNPKWGICILTERGLMATTPQNWVAPVRGAAKERLKQEPGRMEGATYVPNRIFRGRIIEALRDAHTGMQEEEIGRHILLDWNSEEPKDWLKKMINKLVQERMIEEKEGRYLLFD